MTDCQACAELCGHAICDDCTMDALRRECKRYAAERDEALLDLDDCRKDEAALQAAFDAMKVERDDAREAMQAAINEMSRQARECGLMTAERDHWKRKCAEARQVANALLAAALREKPTLRRLVEQNDWLTEAE